MNILVKHNRGVQRTSVARFVASELSPRGPGDDRAARALGRLLRHLIGKNIIDLDELADILETPCTLERDR